MQEILDIFLEKSKQHHSNIIYAQIYKNDLLKEEFRLFPVKTRLNIWSISKPFVAMAAGIAEREGLITLDEYIYPWFEKYFPSDPSENLYKIKIRDLLTMSSGQKDPLFFCDGPERYREKDWVRYFLYTWYSFCVQQFLFLYFICSSGREIRNGSAELSAISFL